MLKYENAKSKKYGNSQLSMKLWKFIQKSNYRNMETQPTAEARKSKKYGNLLKSINIGDITRDVEAVIFQTLPLPLPPTKTEKRPLTIFLKFLWVCSLPSPTLYYFEKTKTFIYCYYFTYFA